MISDCGSITGQAIDPTWNRVMLERMMRKPEVRLAMSVTTVVGLQRLKRKAQANIAEKRRREKMSRGDRKVAQLERKKTASRLDDVVTPRRSG